MTNNITALPRNIRFNQQNIRTFLKGSSFLNTPLIAKQNYNAENQPKMFANTYNHNNINVRVMGFDNCNKNNLLLKACNAQDIQYVTKNPIIYQQEIIVFSQHSKSNKNIPKQTIKQQYKAKTTKDFYKLQQNIAEEQNNKLSKQAEFNEFLFNYRKQQQEKKNKKLKFLQQIETRINNIEKQTYSLAEEKQKQYEQLNGILKIQQNTTKLANKADLVGKLNNAIHEADCYDRIQLLPPKKITENMAFLQMNAAIGEQHQYNNNLLDEIQRVSRSKSKSKSKNKVKVSDGESSIKMGNKKVGDDFHPQPTSLSKTLRRPMQVPPRPSSSKKMATTWKGKLKH